MTEFERWENEQFDRYNGEYQEITEADLFDELFEEIADDFMEWKYEQWRYQYEGIA